MSTVAVVTMTFNTRPDWLLACLESVRGQRYPHEHLIADDGSTDPATIAALEKHGIQRWEHKGPGHGRLNDLISRTSADYIAVLDHDDVMLPNQLRRRALYLDRHPEVALVSGYARCIDKRGKSLRKTWRYGGPYYASIPPNYADGTPRIVFHSGCMYRRSWWEKVGGYPHTHPSDAAFFRALTAAGALFTVMPEEVALKRIWEGSCWWNEKKQNLLSKQTKKRRRRAPVRSRSDRRSP